MSTAGIIAEYDPLHNGHAYHIKKTRETTGCERVIVVMSGSFVQRGEPAAYSKQKRAMWAVKAGADIVLELPVVYSLQSADRFAFGGVSILGAAGAKVLSFGSERPDADMINAAAGLLNGGALNRFLREGVKSGITYARAVTDAAEQAGEPELSEMLKKPNFLLGAQYAANIQKCAPDMKMCAVERKGAQHGEQVRGGYMSASAIRKALSEKRAEDIKQAVPDWVYEYVSALAPASLEDMEQCILYRLLTTEAEALSRVCGVNEGMENLMMRGARENSLCALLETVKSKRYTMARIKSALCCALLDIDAELAASKPEYIRVLAMRKNAAPLLGSFTLPAVCKKADIKRLPESAKRMIQKDMLACELRGLTRSGKGAPERDFSQKLIVV